MVILKKQMSMADLQNTPRGAALVTLRTEGGVEKMVKDHIQDPITISTAYQRTAQVRMILVQETAARPGRARTEAYRLPKEGIKAPILHDVYMNLMTAPTMADVRILKAAGAMDPSTAVLAQALKGKATEAEIKIVGNDSRFRVCFRFCTMMPS